MLLTAELELVWDRDKAVFESHDRIGGFRLNTYDGRTNLEASTGMATSGSEVPEHVVSVIVPVRDGGEYLRPCLDSVLAQDFAFNSMSVSVFDDGSQDQVVKTVLHEYKDVMANAGITFVVSGNLSGSPPRGVGGARNAAISACRSRYLIFLDADDVMARNRVSRQVAALDREGPNTIIGGNFDRIPDDATPRYRDYHRRLDADHNQLLCHAFRDAPLVMPSIACSREAWQRVGGFVEGPGIPEDLHFIYSHLKVGGRLSKVPGDSVVLYRYHNNMTSMGLDRRILLQVRVRAFEEIVLNRQWATLDFMIWGAGRDGRAFFRSLSPEEKERVAGFCDVDVKKIGTLVHGRPVVGIEDLEPPFVTCVALDRTGGAFEQNLKRTGYVLGDHYYYIN